MKVAFWSNGRGRSCVTSNLACLSVLSVLGCPNERTIIFENHRNIINLGSTLFDYYSDREIRENYQYHVDCGLDRVLRMLEQGKEMTEEHLYCLAKDYLGKRLFYLPTEEKSAENLEYYLEREAVRAMFCMEQHSDMVLVDTTAAPLASSRRILQQTDMVVVNLSQNQQMLDHFFRNYKSIQKRAFYLIGNYDTNSELTRDEIMKRYHIPASRMGVIPHNANFSDAISNGRLIPFILKNYQCDSDNENYEFMVSAKEAVELFRHQILHNKKGKSKDEK